MIRRSRCVHVTVILVILQLVGFLILRRSAPQVLTPLHHLPFKLGELAALFSERDAYSFNLWCDRVFQGVLRSASEEPELVPNAEKNEDKENNEKKLKEKDEERARLRLAHYLVNASAEPNHHLVSVPSFLGNDDYNPHLLPFDPRFTLSMILHDINNVSALKENYDFSYTLPLFHWADWTDLSVLHPHFLSFGDSRSTCTHFITRRPRRTKKNPNPVVKPPSWCLEDHMVAWTKENEDSDLYFKGCLQEILKSPYRTGFHIFQYGQRSTKPLKALEGASFLNDFMPKPLSVVLLLPHESGNQVTIQLGVNHEIGSRQRLVDSDLAQRVARETTTLDLRLEVSALSEAIRERPAVLLHPVKEVVHEDFVDPSDEQLLELSQKTTLSANEVNYYKSLHLSTEVERPTKYFYEAQLLRSTKNWGLGGHYDWRFFKDIINFSEYETLSLHGLTQAWLRFTNANNLTTWVAHGSLLSWYWNGISFPWDADVDVQMPVKDLHKLSRHFNQSVIVDFGTNPSKEVKTGRYFLDCGTWVSHRRMGNGLNNIDARFIDMDTGLYIDITGLAVSNTFGPERYDHLVPKELERPVYENRKKNTKQRGPDEREFERNTYLHLYNCRNNHFTRLEEITPMTLSYFEGVPAWIPKGFVPMLEEEYKEGGLVQQKFKNYVFLPRLRLWVEMQFISDFVNSIGNDFKPMLELGHHRSKALGLVDKVSIYSMSDENYLELMARHPQLLTEYLATREVTEVHESEMRRYLKKKSTSDVLFGEEGLRRMFESFRRGFLDYRRLKDGYDFDKKVEELTGEVESFRLGQSAKVAEMKLRDEQAPKLEPMAIGEPKPGEILFQTPELAAKQPKRPELLQ